MMTSIAYSTLPHSQCFMTHPLYFLSFFSPYKFIWMVCFMLHQRNMHADLVPSSTHWSPTIPSQQTSSSSYLAPRSTYQQTSSTLLTSSFSPSPTPTVVSYTFMSSEGMKVSATGYIYIYIYIYI